MGFARQSVGMVTHGGDQGFERFFRAEHSNVLGLAVVMSGDRETARDIVQEAFLRAYRDWERVATLDAPAAWVKRVAVNLSIDRHRKRGNERIALERLHARPSLEPTFDDPAADSWWRAVRELPDRQRAVVALHYLDDMPIKEVAAVLEIAPGTVKSSLSKARSTLARTLGPREADR